MTQSPLNLSRRSLLSSAAFGAMAATVPGLVHANSGTVLPAKAASLPLKDVRLLPSPFLNAVEVNQRYLMALEPDRLLHNYHKFAGLPVKGEIYGGWELDTIAGEALGHYLSALSLMYAQTGHAECVTRITYIIDELAKCQAAHGDGYVAGFMRKRKDGTVVDGKEIFPEIMAGDIRSMGFDLNGCWVPFYNWHKLYAGLMDAQTYTGNDKGIAILIGLSGYIEKVFAPLNEAQIQTVLDCEFGGINESFAELYSRTQDPRWLKMAQVAFYHKKVMAPLAEGRDELANLHANTQVPKLIGLARLHEITGEAGYAKASGYFWERVVKHHSYVIGGNADREHFFEPDNVAGHITEQTCESCNTYNMLKLTRHLYSWSPDASYFDFYERAHLNHMLAHQHPQTGMFTYMMPLMSGTARRYSTPFETFTCCLLSGTETHSKHGELIYWQQDDTLFVNLYIPSTAAWTAQKADFELTTQYPYEGQVALKLKRLNGTRTFTVAMRIPGWARSHTVLVNGKPALATTQKGYALIRRKWRAGDVVKLDLPLELRLETPPSTDKVVSILRGPMVLAADLGEAGPPTRGEVWEGTPPVLVGADILAGLKPVAGENAVYRTQGLGRPGDVTLKPFYAQYERRIAVYFNRYTDAEWVVAQAEVKAEQARLKALAERSMDVMYLGEMQPERDHNLTTGGASYPVTYRGRKGRDARTDGFFEFDMAVTKDGKEAGPLTLQATYWGSEVNKNFYISIEGVRIAHQLLTGTKPGEFFDIDYGVPIELTRGKSKVRIRFEPAAMSRCGPVFGVRIFTADKGDKA
ncbi:glycoside hydrolase family 127 protein [Asticcacaulis sp. ZE23SCel15]|uniref:glycoside hydrolase family 127 protein n=1 Tax=Asticcacaulis sp. ZE23SCel15 TaxID=3059027 RepID=UPI00265DF745|nr:glycoside hydrolase family 127 protein [Asticcacaulis sp. ZE23SCel15]WKL58807.1 glycoside hydrolase family 127 protein [Asticcacaulis sp. ZE23SCel15]